MPQIVTNTAEEVRNAAKESGLIPVDGRLNCATLPVLRWTGSWQEFLHIAKSAGARLLYLDLIEFHPTELMISHVTECLDDFGAPDEVHDSPDFIDQIYHRLEDVIRPWVPREGEPARLVCTWVVDGVAHVWKAEQKWFIECRQAIEEALDVLYEGEMAGTEH